MDTFLAIPAALCMALALGGCGGNSGGGSDSAAPSTTQSAVAQGAWSGTNSLGNAFDMLLLENGELYQVFGSSSNGVFTPLGLDWGRYSVSGNTLGAAITQYISNGTRVTGTLTATVVSGTSISGSAGSNANNSSVSFSARPSSLTHPGYDYNAAAALGDIAGAWTGGVVLGQSTAFAISIDPATGALASSNLGCSFSGSITPRSTRKNVFDVSLTMGQAPCANAGQAYTGVAISYAASTGQRQLIATLQSPDKTLGTVLYALR